MLKRFKPFAKIHPDVKGIEVTLNHAVLHIHHENRRTLGIGSNHKSNWSVAGNRIRQVKPAGSHPDGLHVLIPSKWAGYLTLNTEHSQIHIDYWHKDKVKIKCSKVNVISIRKLTDLTLFSVNSTCDGHFHVKSITTDKFVARLSGAGHVDVDDLTTRRIAVAQQGEGGISIKQGAADVGSLSRTGQGSFKIGQDFRLGLGVSYNPMDGIIRFAA